MANNNIVSNDIATARAAAEAAQAAFVEAQSAALATAKARLTELRNEISQVEAQIKQLGGSRKTRKASKTGARRGRPVGSTRTGSDGLVETVAKVLNKTSKTLSLTDICDKVRATGYETTSENFKVMVSQSLGKLNDLRMGNSLIVDNVERGHWAAGKGMEAYIAYLKDPENNKAPVPAPETAAAA